MPKLLRGLLLNWKKFTWDVTNLKVFTSVIIETIIKKSRFIKVMIVKITIFSILTGLKINSSAWRPVGASFIDFLVAHPKMK